MDTSLSESHSLLTATLAVLETDPTTCDGFDVADDKDDSSIKEHVADAKMPPRNPFSSNFSDAEDSETKEEEDEDKEEEDEVEAEDTPVDDSKTVAEQMETHIGRSNTAEVSNDNNKNKNQNSTPNQSNAALSPIDCATLDVLKLCHNGRGRPRVLQQPFCPASKTLFPKQSGCHQAS
jgi:hypothetical protein